MLHIWDIMQMVIVILSNPKKQLPILLFLIGFFFSVVGVLSMDFRGDNTFLWLGLDMVAVLLFVYFRSRG